MIDRVPVSDDDRPDIAIEVHRKLAVREVWFYERASLHFFASREQSYAEIARSELLPGADPALFVRCMAEPSQTDAIRVLREALRAAHASP